MRKNTTSERLKTWASVLGIEPLALNHLGCVWSEVDDAWCFPMRTAEEEITGLMLAWEDGRKGMIAGSEVGLFYTRKIPIQKRVYILMGPNGTAAAVTLGLTAIGCLSLKGKDALPNKYIYEDLIRDFIRKNQIKEAVVIPRNDEEGLQWADKLQNEMTIPSCQVILPCADLLEFLSLGGDAVTLQSVVKNLIWTPAKRDLQPS